MRSRSWCSRRCSTTCRASPSAGVCASPRAAPSPLVLLVSPWVDEMDRILAFECGVDDFARDPFFPRELASRVQALLRRGRRPRVLADEGETRVGPVRVDFRKSLVEMDGQAVPLTWREFEVLRLLAQEQGPGRAPRGAARTVARRPRCGEPEADRHLREVDPQEAGQRGEPDRDGAGRRLSSGVRQPPLTAIEPAVTTQAEKKAVKPVLSRPLPEPRALVARLRCARARARRGSGAAAARAREVPRDLRDATSTSSSRCAWPASRRRWTPACWRRRPTGAARSSSSRRSASTWRSCCAARSACTRRSCCRASPSRPSASSTGTRSTRTRGSACATSTSGASTRR